jgi:hypothetical protein
MALLIDSRWVARDAVGAPYSGAKLYVYVTGGLTPASVYSDAALTTPLSNPVVADSDGRFAQVFVSADTFDCVLKTSGGVTISSYVGVTGMGDSAGAFTRDFTNSRVSISGTAGVVALEFRPPTGDNIGGSGRICGSNGTQADSIAIDSAATTFSGPITVTGVIDTASTKQLKEAGKRISEVLYTDATSFSGSPTVDVALPNIPSGTRRWRVDFWDVIYATNSNCTLRLSYDNASTFKSGASDYAHQLEYNNAGSYALVYSAGASGAQISSGSSTTIHTRITLDIITPNSGAGDTIIIGTASTHDSTNYIHNKFIARGLGSYGRATHLRLYTNSGTPNVSGVYSVRALRGSGE